MGYSCATVGFRLWRGRAGSVLGGAMQCGWDGQMNQASHDERSRCEIVWKDDRE
jgi:hypothetical protein